MAALFSESFDSGVPGNNVATDETAFDSMNGSSPTYSADSAHGAGSMRIATANGGQSYGIVGVPPSLGIYSRFYLKPVNFAPFYVAQNWSNGSRVARILAGVDGKLQLRTGGYSTISAASSIALSTSHWNRIEWYASTTTQQLRIFQGADLDGNTPTWDSGPLAYAGASIDRFDIGHTDGGTGVGVLIDEFAADDATWVGPFVSAVPDPQPTATRFLLTETGWQPLTTTPL